MTQLPGDTLTEIPSGWVEKVLGEVCDAISDGTHFTPRYVAHGVPFYSVESVTKDDFINVKNISVEEHRVLIKRCHPRRGDILMTRIGSLGETKYLDWDVEASIYVSLALLRPSTSVDGRYLYAFTKTRFFVKGVEDRSLLWAIPKKINMGDIAHVPVLLPVDRAEQAAIADAVQLASDHVSLIGRLIAKKQAIMHGMMQQLLTGKTRLPGFIEPWPEVRLGDHVTYLKTVALSRAQLDETSPLRYLHYGDIHKRDSLTLDASVEPMPRANARLASGAGRLLAGDLVFADASEDPAGVGKSIEIVSVPPEGLVPGLHTIAARFDKSVLTDGFKAYLQFVPGFRQALLRLAAGTKVLATTRKYISSISLTLPPADEQRAIADALNAAGSEIDALRAQLIKAEDISTGIRQQLLTGRMRYRRRWSHHE